MSVNSLTDENSQQCHFRFSIYEFYQQREEEGDMTQSYDKTPYTNRQFENQRTTHTLLMKIIWF